MKDQQNDKSHQTTDSKSTQTPTTDSHKKETTPVAAPERKDKQNGLPQDHQENKNHTTSQTKKVTDTSEKTEDTTIKEKAGSAPAWQKESHTEKAKTK